jgi:uncharacterized protein YidB (DUF937 family)
LQRLGEGVGAAVRHAGNNGAAGEASRQTGMGRHDLLEGLSQHLPGFVDQLTPEGRLPSEEEASRMV